MNTADLSDGHTVEEVKPENLEAPHKHRDFIDEIIGQMRAGHVLPTLADGKNPIYFRPLAHGGENMVLTGMRLPLRGAPHAVPYVLKVGLYEADSSDLEQRRARFDELRKHMRQPDWFLHQHHLLHTCQSGEQRLVTLQQPMELEGAMRLHAGYAELLADWNQAEAGTIGSDADIPGTLPRLSPNDPTVKRYTRVNQALVLDCAEEDAPPVGREEFLLTQRSKPLAALVNQARRDSQMRELLRTFVERAIAYSEATGEIIDILGDGDNVVLHANKKKWALKLLDPLHPSIHAMAHLQSSLVRLSLPELPQGWRADVNHALNGLNYVRTMNGLARTLNIEKRLMGWRRHLSNDARCLINFPLILERCRAGNGTETDSQKTAETPSNGLKCPRQQLEILLRKPTA